ncbi:MAG: AsnC family protein, partial [Gemmatimonadota bacterium]|nr:AsnC family protein [Gemmatimonadota bacterium]
MNDFVAIPSSYQFDDLEERMIEALKPDPLMATSTLAELLGVTRSQVITRLRRIEKNEAAHVLTQINA